MPEIYFNSPRTTPVMPLAKPIHWTPIIIAAVAAGTIISVTDIIRKPLSRPAPIQAAIPVPAPTPVPLPLVMPTPVPLAMPTPEPLVLRAFPVEPTVLRAEPVEPVVKRALPVEGNLYLANMPDGSHPLIRFMGSVGSFDDLPKNPNLYDLYRVASSGHEWVFMQPAGFSAPSWVDP